MGVSRVAPQVDVFPKDVAVWNSAYHAGLSPTQSLVYRSNLLGRDATVTNFGGGNTSAKIVQPDPLTGEPVEVLWVKGSGGDLGSMKLDGFATLYLDRVRSLEKRYRGLAHEDEMVDLLLHCGFGLNPRAASIDTALHAFLPHTHVDHLHPDAVIAIAAAEDSERLTRQVYGDSLGWIGWQRPGFDLGLRIRDAVAANPQWRGMVMAGHGLICWGDTSEACYRNSLRLIRRAQDYIDARAVARPVFGGVRIRPHTAAERAALFTRLTPVLRAKFSFSQLKLAHVSDSPVVLDFVCSHDLDRLAAMGTSCPDHFLRTKIRPLVLDADADDAAIDQALEAYCAGYRAYYQRCKRSDSPPIRDATPVVVLVPGYGMLTFAADKATARIAAEYYVNSIQVMRGAEALDRYVALPEQEAFDIEYWQLEEAKLRRQPTPGLFAGQVAYITGAAGGIGRAIAEAVLQRGGHVVVTDIDGGRLEALRSDLAAAHSADRVRAFEADVTDEAAILESFNYTATQFGGVDLFVANAGIASAASIEETTLELWRRNFAVLSDGYFLAVREAFKAMKPLGGSIVFVGSKNALAPSVNASAYCSAKAAELHLARCLALEGAPHGIRVNVVNPDAVIRGSHIWNGAWRAERAAAYNLKDADIEDFYRNRSLLKRSVLPEDVAEAVVFLASSAASKSTGNILNVDAGNAMAFTR
ncbi:bifunctional rhamnulose-1-phosphate aldolase/short-chain dehydrogenase [Asticcacaulis sp. AC402]|uniref:bifunctional rhamnulose-1-phosphate aldolase/short-chain dehydrogenase n=1 Tax=Asticcacaulis sp. AC402 TaxID=1282361 RepID=UPI0003C41132|nr:bifunctional rhamnulose-1-phosphate aldolase/short-chain dehydrogenase [Asticcacaulis sp. AC402]ESQ76125.1 short-chain dehydrogenase [Asticcacaulis sp. AC402]